MVSSADLNVNVPPSSSQYTLTFFPRIDLPSVSSEPHVRQPSFSPLPRPYPPPTHHNLPRSRPNLPPSRPHPPSYRPNHPPYRSYPPPSPTSPASPVPSLFSFVPPYPLPVLLQSSPVPSRPNPPSFRPVPILPRPRRHPPMSRPQPIQSRPYPPQSGPIPYPSCPNPPLSRPYPPTSRPYPPPSLSKPSLLILGDSNTKHIRLPINFHRIPTYTIGDTDPRVCIGYTKVWIHVGINSLKSIRCGGASDVRKHFDLFMSKIERIGMLSPNTTVIVSPILPTAIKTLNDHACYFNTLLFSINRWWLELDFSIFADDNNMLHNFYRCLNNPMDKIHLGSKGLREFESMILKRTSLVDTRSYSSVVRS